MTGLFSSVASALPVMQSAPTRVVVCLLPYLASFAAENGVERSEVKQEQNGATTQKSNYCLSLALVQPVLVNKPC